MSSSEDNRLKFQSFSSILNPGFWQRLTNVKLNQLKLSQDPVDIHGNYSCNLSETLPCLASFDANSFNDYQAVGTKYAAPLFGQLVCMNIMQEFIDYDKKSFLNHHGNEIWKSICDGRALEDPERCLSRFGLLVYADLKKYKFFYWFCFPALNYPQQVNLAVNGDQISRPNQPIKTILNDQLLQVLQGQYEKSISDRPFQRGYFIIKHFKFISDDSESLQVFPLTQYKQAARVDENQKDVRIYFAYNDPSPSQEYPGWVLRNYLCLIAVQFNLDRVQIVRIRKGQSSGNSKIDLNKSMMFEVAFDLEPTYKNLSKDNIPAAPTITGWEKNESQQMAPKRVDLSSLLDAKRLAEDAVNLNLRLMKWRLLPGLDLNKIANTKCLILGCGTLGCNVARGLLAWGVRNISLVDNSKISHSNPVRQNLYNFDDCVKPGGAFKAEAAAASLKRIHPTINVSSHVFSIPMPGHHVADNLVQQTKKDVEKLEQLIEENDAIFLLMDTRESRWLPTVIAISKQKLVINAAIGFDTFLLQRYGLRSHDYESETSKNNQLPSDKLGCYFCNDIVAPGDSTLDRTLDQQCTVSRPGVSMMVSAMAVELLASVVSSRLGILTPAPLEIETDPSVQDDIDSGCELGIVPHSIRGNLSRYHVYLPTSPCFNKCSACSAAVIQAYQSSGYEFLSKVFEDPSYLEEIAGLKDLQNVSDNVWALESDDEALEDIEKMNDNN